MGYDPETGEERWHSNSLLQTIMTSPVVKDDLIYMAVQIAAIRKTSARSGCPPASRCRAIFS